MHKAVISTVALIWVVVTAMGCSDPYAEGMKAQQAGRYKEALTQFQQVRKLGQEYQAAQQHLKALYFLIGKAAYERQDWDEAVEYLKKVTSDDKVHYDEVQDLLGVIRYQQGKAAYEQGDGAEAGQLLQLVRSTCSAYEDAQTLLKKLNAQEERAAP